MLSFVGPLYDAPGLQCGACMQIVGGTTPPGGCRSTYATGGQVATERAAAAGGPGNPATNDDIWNNGFPSLVDDPSKIHFENAPLRQGKNRFIDDAGVWHSFMWFEWMFDGVVFRTGYEITDDAALQALPAKRHHKHLHKVYLKGHIVPVWVATVKAP
ncbi:MAG TPA: hypothetical protein VGN42_25915 [Pirellulales bacterium]|nr:hypothetical protein [Pirellulales bacterium]